jgi:hypothetical protein
VGNKLVEWNNLVARVANIYLQHGPNVFVWSLHKNGIFSVNTMYEFLVSNQIKVSTIVWKLKIPFTIGNRLFAECLEVCRVHSIGHSTNSHFAECRKQNTRRT